MKKGVVPIESNNEKYQAAAKKHKAPPMGYFFGAEKS
jgi:hypothetical protein